MVEHSKSMDGLNAYAVKVEQRLAKVEERIYGQLEQFEMRLSMIEERLRFLEAAKHYTWVAGQSFCEGVTVPPEGLVPGKFMPKIIK